MAATPTASVRRSDLDPITALPDRYRQIVTGIVRSQRYLTWCAVAGDKPEYLLLRNTDVSTKVFLSTTESGGVFSFRRPRTEEVILDASIAFSVRPALEGPVAPPQPIRALTALLPPFLDGGIPRVNQQLLARALNRDPQAGIIYLSLGLFYLAAANTQNINETSVAFMWHAASRADVVFQRIGDNAFQYAPVPFLMLLRAVSDWSNAGTANGTATTIPLTASPEAIPSILAALAETWTLVNRCVAERHRPDPLGDLLPDFEITGFKAGVTLRLQPNGKLARKSEDDTFRLRFAVTAQQGELRLDLGVPDFLLSGELYDQLLEKIRHPDAIARMFAASGLEQPRRPEFHAFLAANAPVIFRARKQGDLDLEVFVFEGTWEGENKALAASLPVRVRKVGEDMEVAARPKDVQILFHDLIPHPPLQGVEFPLFLIALINQLQNWKESLQ